MSLYLFATIVSFVFTSILIVPFIDFLYRLKVQRVHQETMDAFRRRAHIFDRFNETKAGIPVGGGILIIATTILLFSIFIGFFNFFNLPVQSNYQQALWYEIGILFFTFISFGLLGLYDDLNKIFFWRKAKFFGLRLTHKLLIEIALALVISCFIYFGLKIQVLNIPFLKPYLLGYFYIPFATFIIVAFANAVNITDGLDGLASGVMMIALASLWVISRTILDVPTSIFIGVWLGALISFLYFNIYPARLFLGDAGALSFGATFAVVGLILGKIFALPIIGAIFVVEIFTSLVQLLSKRFRRKKAFPVAPLHLWLQLRGWEEPKIVMRFWILSIIFAIFGLLIAFLK